MSQDDYGQEIPEHPLTDRQVDQVAEAVVHKIGEKWIDREEHALHHEWVKHKIESEDQFNDSKRRVIENVVGAASTMGLLGFFGLMGKALIDFAAKHIGT